MTDPPEGTPNTDWMMLFSSRLSLRQYVQEFEASVALFWEASELTNRWETPWKMLAVKQAIVSAYNFSMALKGVRTLARKASDSALVVKTEAARERLRAAFPDLKELRQTVLHEAEKHWSEERDQENRTRGVTSNELGEDIGPGIGMSSCIFEDTYVATFAGKEVRLQMTPDNVALLYGLLEGLDPRTETPEN